MSKKLVIPCLRGKMGTWDTYTCLMQLKDISDLINFATDLHTSEKLSQMIQRNLEDERAVEIGEYLLSNQDHFFNSLVVAIYDGDPQWHDFARIDPNTEEAELLEMPDYARECLGFLSLTKEEKMFALDGQHRLSGIKKAVQKDEDIGFEQLSVIIVTHRNTQSGIKKSRRLFTTLNKKAKLVRKDAIIALDEDDISACITRRVVEETKVLNESNVSFSVGSLRDKTNITTLGNIFDCVQKLVAFSLGCKVSEIEQKKISEDNEIELFDFVKEFYELTFSKVSALTEFNDNRIIDDFRNSVDGGHLLFRPIGWEIYTESVIELISGDYELEKAVFIVCQKDMKMSGKILKNNLWSAQRGRILKVSATKLKKMKQELTKTVT
ncbi:DGQHR domain-containing protein [Vibrio sp. ED004]|uniref:DNA sulfur modification protein DndB n=1 Tax=Vibrio sp. ED004 TaxID=2785124 RepID=UPI00206EB209|nr:DNA sulfur modification protein DndB [Vibrio sp. ED004]UPR57313.1 DGQHR domain-containing protein [Vibrio sp. ED004]